MREIMKARKKDAPVKPPAELEKRPGDGNLPGVLYLACKVFARLKSKPSPNKFPGTLVLRHYRPGQVICWQGDPGWTAFCILSDDDLRALHAERDKQLAELPAKLQKAREKGNAEAVEEAEALEAALKRAVLPAVSAQTDDKEPPARVYIDLPRARVARPTSLLERLFGWRELAPAESPRFIRVDPSTLIDYGTRTAPMPEGRVFGEWSCMYGTPRSATIVAERERYVLEMLRNVLDSILGDAQFQKDTDEEYVKSVLATHLAGLSIFRELTAEQLNEIRSGLELVRYRDGEVIFNRHDPADAIYIVRRGLVKVLLNDWPLLTPADVIDGKALAALASGYLAGKLKADIRDLLGKESLSREEKERVVAALNALLRDSHMSQSLTSKKPEPAAELKPLLDSPAFLQAEQEDFAKSKADWADQDWRRYNRLILESLCPGALRTVRPRRVSDTEGLPQSASEEILGYLMHGEFFGEMGVMLDQPRTATCVAYVHPRPEPEQVDPVGDRWRRDEERIELVKVPAALFRALCERHPSIKARVAEQIARHQKASQKHETRRAWTDGERTLQSDRFQQMGLIQGQKLMLIDLDRCTRCDECVEACVKTHTDGRSRLFLDGPRFDRYLVPTTCRACRDPVCLIGCPVGSIRRGSNLDIVIENWCIGCQQCAKNCPYGSIQMHDQGILSEQAHGWRFFPASRAASNWHQPSASDRSWSEGATPFLWDHELRAELALKRGREDDAVCFRRSFTLEPELLSSADGGVKIVIDSKAKEIEVEGEGRQAKVKRFLPVWLNGAPIAAERWKVGQDQQFMLELSGDERSNLRSGRNILAIQATPRGRRETLLQVAIDEVRPSGAVMPLLAVVCDQCSGLPDGQPACVHACPHDAAMRVDAAEHFRQR